MSRTPLARLPREHVAPAAAPRPVPGGAARLTAPQVGAAGLVALAAADVVLLPELLTERPHLGDGLALLCLAAGAAAWTLWPGGRRARWVAAAVVSAMHAALALVGLRGRAHAGTPVPLRAVEVVVLVVAAGVAALAVGVLAGGRRQRP